MKNIKLFTLAAAALVLGMTSCSKDNDTASVDKGVMKTVEVSIKSSGFTRAAAADEAGVGKENDITNWFAFAKHATDNDYTCVEVTSSTGIASFTKVPVGSTVYVVANPAAATMTGISNGATVTEATITGLIESVIKADLQANTAALQASAAAPAVNPMLMSGSAKVSANADPSDSKKVKVTVQLQREYAKVNMTVLPVAGTQVGTESDTESKITIDEITKISAYRVVKRISPFKTQLAEWYIKKTPYVGDDSVDNTTEPVGASDFVYHYTPATGQAQSFYVTPNYAGLSAYATAVIVEAKVTGKWNGLNYDGQKRYYRAFVYDDSIVDTDGNKIEEGKTLKNMIYNITGEIKGIGEGTPGEALDKDNVDLNVYVEVKNWQVRVIGVDME